MNVPTVVASTLLAGISTWAGGLGPTAWRTVKICVGPGNATHFTVTRAEAIAEKMFTDIGVKIEWHDGEHDCKSRPQESIIINFSAGVSAMHLPGALAYARPYDGVHIEVFYDRVVMTEEPRRVPSVLAHILAHEVAHILQGVSRHSEEGIMKARWNERDLLEMAWKPLPFTPLDVELIERGMDTRLSRLAKRN